MRRSLKQCSGACPGVFYYEMGELDALYSRCRALSTYIQRNKTLAEKNKTAYANLVRFIRRLSKVQYEKKRNLEKIIEDFKSCRNLVERSWLEEKIRLLKN